MYSQNFNKNKYAISLAFTIILSSAIIDLVDEHRYNWYIMYLDFMISSLKSIKDIGNYLFT
jgi:hypothetical protein